MGLVEEFDVYANQDDLNFNEIDLDYHEVSQDVEVDEIDDVWRAY